MKSLVRSLFALVVLAALGVRCADRASSSSPEQGEPHARGSVRRHADHERSRSSNSSRAADPSESASVHLALGTPEPRTPESKTLDPDDDFRISRPEYALSYSRHRQGPNWAAWRITASDFGGAERQGHFQPDDALPSGWYRVRHEDYTASGFDRGHMVRSEDRTSSASHNAATFLTTNILPQKHDLNGGPWRGLEDACRVLSQHDGRWVYVVAGGLYGASPRTIGRGHEAHVAVPEAFWKVAVVLPPGGAARDVTASTEVLAVIMPNREGVAGNRWTTYRVTLGEVERQSGWRLLGAVRSDARAILEEKRP